jgi:hypothetical protein
VVLDLPDVALGFFRLAVICFTSPALNPAAHSCGFAPETHPLGKLRYAAKIKNSVAIETGYRGDEVMKVSLPFVVMGPTEDKLFDA